MQQKFWRCIGQDLEEYEMEIAKDEEKEKDNKEEEEK